MRWHTSASPTDKGYPPSPPRLQQWQSLPACKIPHLIINTIKILENVTFSPTMTEEWQRLMIELVRWARHCSVYLIHTGSFTPPKPGGVSNEWQRAANLRPLPPTRGRGAISLPLHTLTVSARQSRCSCTECHLLSLFQGHYSHNFTPSQIHHQVFCLSLLGLSHQIINVTYFPS